MLGVARFRFGARTRLRVGDTLVGVVERWRARDGERCVVSRRVELLVDGAAPNVRARERTRVLFDVRLGVVWMTRLRVEVVRRPAVLERSLERPREVVVRGWLGARNTREPAREVLVARARVRGVCASVVNVSGRLCLARRAVEVRVKER